MYQKKTRIVWFVICILVNLLPHHASADENYIISGASPSGLWSLLGAGVSHAVEAANSGSTVTYQTSAGGFANIELISRGDVDLGIVHDAELSLAVLGQQPFIKAYPDLRAVAVMYDFAILHPLITEAFSKKYNVYSLADIREKKAPLRVVINRHGNIARDVAIRLFEAHGITIQDIENWGGSVHTTGSRGAVKLIKSRQADMITNIVFIGHSAIRELSAAIPVRLLQLDKTAVKKTAAELGIATKVIPADAYEWLSQDIQSLSLSAILTTSSSMDANKVYTLTESLINHLDKFQRVHTSMKQTTLKSMSEHTTIPYHKGASKAFAKAGYQTPNL